MNRIELISDDDLELRLAMHLQQGRMPDPFLYIGESGTHNWLTLDSSDEFPVATRLQDLLEQSLPELVQALPKSPDVVSLGVGRGEKERLLLQALIRTASARYFAVDVSSPMVDEALRTALDLPIAKNGIVAFVEDLPRIREYWSSPVVLCLLGNNFSNYEPDALLGLVREQLQSEDFFLFDCHLLPPDSAEGMTGREAVQEIYGSSQNALFNMGPLVERGMNASDCAFNLELITVNSTAGPACRTHKWLQILADTKISCGPQKLHLARGATIELGFTFKHTLPQLEIHLAREGFHPVRAFVDQNNENALVLARPYT